MLRATFFMFLFLVVPHRTIQFEHKPYPPCDECECAGNACKDKFPPEVKLEWPELVGVDEIMARETIGKTNPYVTVVAQYKGCTCTAKTCCNRVKLCLKPHPNYVITMIPMVG